MSKATEHIIKGLLQLNPEKRLTATQVRDQLKAIIDGSVQQSTDHLVPEFTIGSVDAGLQSMSLETPIKEKWKKVCNSIT